jgi:radical SAM superfamily enzyme YgiQ (UPF0313 family)
MQPSLLLVSPPDYLTREFRGAQPLGIAYLAATLREQGIASVLLDANAGVAMPMAELIGRVQQFVAAAQGQGSPPVVGISAVSQVLPASVELASAIKASHPDTLIIMGGYHPTFAHREILQDFPTVDLCVRGEGEQTLLEIMRRWLAHPVRPATAVWDGIRGVTWRGGGEIVVNPSRPNLTNLDAVPFPARDLLPHLDQYPPYIDLVAGKARIKASIMSSRGCPFHCNFCSIISFYGDAGGRPWRGRSVDNVVAEMAHLADAFGASHFEFQDDNFFVQPQRALAIAEGMASTGRDFSFAFLTRADQIVRGERYFAALRRAGLRYVSVGIESGSDAALQRMVKETSVETNRRALQILHDHDVAAQVEFIMFEPGSTLADLQANLRFLETQGLFGYFPPLVFGSLLLFPGTPVREEMERDFGLQGSIHETLPYTFPDGRVAAVQGVMTAFQQRLGEPWYAQAFALLDGIPALELAWRNGSEDGYGGAEANQRRLAELKLEFFALTRIPYNLLRSALAQVADGQIVAEDTLLAKARADLEQARARLAGFGFPETGPQGGQVFDPVSLPAV